MAISTDASVIASGGLDKTVRLWDRENGCCLAELPLGFPLYSVAIGANQLIAAGAAGCLLAIDINNLRTQQWHPQFQWVHRGIGALVLSGLNISQALHVSTENQRLCKQRGSRGEPNKNEGITYQPWCQLFKPIVGTAHHQAQLSLVGIEHQRQSQRRTVSENVWVLSVARKHNNRISAAMVGISVGALVGISVASLACVLIGAGIGGWVGNMIDNNTGEVGHGFLIIEGIRQNRRFIVRAELTTTDGRQAAITLRPLDNLKQFKKSASMYEANQFEITADEGERLLRNIRSDQQEAMRYSQLGDGVVSYYGSSSSWLAFFGANQQIETHSCLSWCRKQVKGIATKDNSTPKYEIPRQWYNFLVTLPKDVTQPFTHSSKSNSSNLNSSSSSSSSLSMNVSLS